VAYLGATALALPLDAHIASAARDSAVQHAPGLSHMARGFDLIGFPGTVLLGGGLYGAGRIAGNADMADVGLHMGEAMLIAEVATYAVKFVTGRARPSVSPDDAYDFKLGRGFAWDDTYRSFPSGHTTAAFAVAAVAAHEIERIHGGDKLLIGLATYGPAALVGAARVFHDRHWASDVVLGAAIGAFSGWKVVRYTHTHPDNRIDDWFLAGSMVPGDWSTLRIGIVPRVP
jgi:membrane-associated phospholipid phosphatase